jgi:hypothetical protein
VEIFVQDVEPSGTVLLRGDVPLELAEPIETVAEWLPPTTVVDESPCIELPSVDPPILDRPSSGFIPFSGKGNRLGN